MVDISATIQPFARLPISASDPGSRPGAPPGAPPGTPMENNRLRAEAERFEAAFLAEMLRHSGLGRMPESFNGGAGEAAFSGTLVQEYANRIAVSGTLGIADRIYETLTGQSVK